MLDYYCHVLPHLPVCVQTSLVCWDAASECVDFHHLSLSHCRFQIDVSIEKDNLGSEILDLQSILVVGVVFQHFAFFIS